MAFDAAWLAAHKVPVGVGGGGLIAGIAYLRSRQAKAAAAAGPASPYGASPSVTTAGGVAAGDPYNGASDVYSSIEPQLQSLQQQLASVNGSSAQAGAAAVSASTLSGAGYYTPTNKSGVYGDTSGHSKFQLLTNNEQYAAAMKGGQVFYQPTAGNFQPWTQDTFNTVNDANRGRYIYTPTFVEEN